MFEFAELARVRNEVRESTVNHVASLLYFKNSADSSFFKTAADVETQAGAAAFEHVRASWYQRGEPLDVARV